MVHSRLHVICGNCGALASTLHNNDNFSYVIDMKGQDFGDHFKPSVRIQCDNCWTIHSLEETVQERIKS